MAQQSEAPAFSDEVTAEAARILDSFNKLGLKRTHPRRIVAERLALLADAGNDFTVHDLYEDIRRVEPGIGRATVFRAVEVLAGEGILDRVPVAAGTHRYRLCGGHHHHHLRCNSCQRVVEIGACLPAETFVDVALATDFRIEGHSLEFFGQCAECRADT